MSRDQHRNALRPGHRIEWYEIRRILGQGGFGITYLAIDTNLDQEVAIKEYLPIELAVREGDHTVHPASGAHGEQFQWGKDRFISEARTLAKFKHPNIVRVFSVFEAMNTAYMIMEYEHGESLQDKLAGRRTMDESELLRIAFPIMDGLKCVHDAGFIHRDIKPANIFIRADGSPVLLDFGSARQAMGNATRTLTALVSPGYAPFEQYYSKSDEQGAWTDIYGLGATLYRAASGVAPLDAMDRSRSLIDATPDTFIPTSRMTEGRYSERFQRAVDHALQFKAADRPQSVAEWREEFGIGDAVAALQQREEQESSTTQPTRIVRRPGGRKPRRARTLAMLAAGVTALAAAAWFALPALQQPEPGAANTAEASTPVPTPVIDEPATASAQPAAPTVSEQAPGAAATPPATSETTASTAVPKPEQVDEQAQRISALYAAAEAERAREAEAQRLAEEQAVREAEQQARLEQERVAAETTTREAEAKAELEAQARKTEQQRLAEEAEAQAQREAQARKAEQERLAAEAAERENEAKAQRAAQAREAEQQRLAAEAAAREEEKRRIDAQRAEEDRKAEQTRLAAEQATPQKPAPAVDETTRLALAQGQAQACEARNSLPLAEPARAGSGAYFAAIAVGNANGWGEAWGYESQADAEQVALSGCKQNDSGCAVQVWSNDCVAFVAGPKGAAGWSWGASVNDARQRALGFCEEHGSCCTLMTAYCADELR